VEFFGDAVGGFLAFDPDAGGFDTGCGGATSDSKPLFRLLRLMIDDA
jgi:hypothetical protein